MGTDNPVHLTANVARYSQRAHFSYCVYVHIFAYSSAMWLDPHRRIPLCILCAVCVGTVVCGNGFLQNSELWIETLKSKSQNLKIWTFQSSEKCGNFHKRLSLRIYVFRPCWVFGSPTSFTGVEASICYHYCTSNFENTIPTSRFDQIDRGFFLPPQVHMLLGGSLLPNPRNHGFGGKNQ